jgi:hypothetical protein
MAHIVKKQSAASVVTPAAGEMSLFVDSADDKLKRKDSTSTVTIIETVGGSSASSITNVPSGDIVATNVQDAIDELDAEKAPIGHVGAGGPSQHPIATGSVAGFMSPSDFTKLGTVASGATANDTDANLRARASHTGTQAASTISDFNTAADSRVTAGIATHVGLADPHPGYALDADVTAAQAFAAARANHTGTQTASTISDFTAASKAAAVQDAISNGITDVAPSQNAVFDALALKSDVGHTHVVADITDYAASQALKANKSGDTFTGPVVARGNNAGTGYVNYEAQTSDPATPASGVNVFSDQAEMFGFKGQSGFKAVFNDQNMTQDRQFDLPDADVELMGNPMTTLGDAIYGGVSGLPTRLPIGDEDDILRVMGGIPSWEAENLGQDFGGGSLGNATISGAVTLLQETYYNELTLAAGCNININGFNLYAKKIIATAAGITGAIQGNGNNGSNATGTGGGAGGIALNAATNGASTAGGAGAAGNANNGVQGAAGGVLTTSNGGAGGASGNSGAGGSGIGANAIAGGTVGNYTKLDRFIYDANRGILQINAGAGGRGGNSGGGDGANISRGAGGGGGGARVVKIYCGELVTSVSTPAGVIQANGGNGGVQNNPPPAGNVGGPSGGGGGGGGAIMFMYGKKTGPVVSNFLQANGGSGGNGTASLGSGIAGAGGQGGNGGTIQTFNTSTNAGVEVIGAVGSVGSAASGLVPGVGGSGGICQLSL